MLSMHEVEQYFYPYGRAMLGALLNQSGARTQPVVAYGGPAHEWLKSAFPTQVKRMPKLFSVLELRVGPGQALTPEPGRPAASARRNGSTPAGCR